MDTRTASTPSGDKPNQSLPRNTAVPSKSTDDHQSKFHIGDIYNDIEEWNFEEDDNTRASHQDWKDKSSRAPMQVSSSGDKSFMTEDDAEVFCRTQLGSTDKRGSVHNSPIQDLGDEALHTDEIPGRKNGMSPSFDFFEDEIQVSQDICQWLDAPLSSQEHSAGSTRDVPKVRSGHGFQNRSPPSDWNRKNELFDIEGFHAEDRNPPTRALALLEPASDGANANVGQEHVDNWYPNSIPLTQLYLEDSTHKGTIRMFAPERYLEPRGDYYLADQLPEGTGNNGKGQLGRCETCHQLFRDHTTPLPSRFTCTNGCVFSSLSESHPPHANMPCPQLYMTQRSAQRRLKIKSDTPYPAVLQVFPSKFEFLILQANGYIQWNETYNAQFVPKFTQQCRTKDLRMPTYASRKGLYKHVPSAWELGVKRDLTQAQNATNGAKSRPNSQRRRDHGQAQPNSNAMPFATYHKQQQAPSQYPPHHRGHPPQYPPQYPSQYPPPYLPPHHMAHAQSYPYPYPSPGHLQPHHGAPPAPFPPGYNHFEARSQAPGVTHQYGQYRSYGNDTPFQNDQMAQRTAAKRFDRTERVIKDVAKRKQQGTQEDRQESFPRKAPRFGEGSYSSPRSFPAKAHSKGSTVAQQQRLKASGDRLEQPQALKAAASDAWRSYRNGSAEEDIKIHNTSDVRNDSSPTEGAPKYR